ncbi:MAG: thioredoxin domain-containing protein [Candidatus Hydrogenedentes bacterium]|nr:thioredoxin domain-containing protein [Candidatus Hydrogenedentota bacterium]
MSHAANRLAGETSPYLLQHAHNPVQWYPWGEEALARAKVEDKPIFLSIGYAACHWCHVMERESFENEGIAEILNEHFVSIKVDREERPDLDEIYMNAVVAMTGSGGWPMSVFLTPQLQPFYGGTYYPPMDLYGRPGFATILTAVANAWRDRRSEVERSAQGMTDHLRKQLSRDATAARGSLTPALLTEAASDLHQSFDPAEGGWGGAPKFPSSGSIQVLLRAHDRSPDPSLLDMCALSLRKMAWGGMYDHLGGGFHRYSVDARWLVPHFEKMLYDNAQLAQAYLEAYQVTQDPLYRRVVEETLNYELRDMQDTSGGFHSTEDADSEGEEGKFYVWTEGEIMDALGAEAGRAFCAYYTVKPNGNFESHEPYHAGQNILHITRSLEEVAVELGMAAGQLEDTLRSTRAQLLEVRTRRVRPGLDDKILTSWNGLMIATLAQAAQVLDSSKFREAAERAARFILDAMQRDGRLLRTHRKGESRLPGYLEDYAFTANAFVDLYEATFEVEWLKHARTLADAMIQRFWDDTAGMFRHTGEEHRDVLLRVYPTYDGAEPSGNSVAALALLRLGKFLNVADYSHKALTLLETNHNAMAQAPRGYLKMLCAADFALGPVREIAIVGRADDDATRALLSVVRARFLPRKIVARAEGPMEGEASLPLLSGRTLVEGKAAAFVCENYTCKLPVTETAALEDMLRQN